MRLRVRSKTTEAIAEPAPAPVDERVDGSPDDGTLEHAADNGIGASASLSNPDVTAPGGVFASLAAVVTWKRAVDADFERALGPESPFDVAAKLRTLTASCDVGEIEEILSLVERLRPELRDLARILTALKSWKAALAAGNGGGA